MIIYIPKFTKRTLKEIRKQAKLRWLKSNTRKRWLKKLHKKLMI